MGALRAQWFLLKQTPFLPPSPQKVRQARPLRCAMMLLHLLVLSCSSGASVPRVLEQVLFGGERGRGAWPRADEQPTAADTVRPSVRDVRAAFIGAMHWSVIPTNTVRWHAPIAHTTPLMVRAARKEGHTLSFFWNLWQILRKVASLLSKP